MFAVNVKTDIWMSRYLMYDVEGFVALYMSM